MREIEKEKVMILSSIYFIALATLYILHRKSAQHVAFKGRRACAGSMATRVGHTHVCKRVIDSVDITRHARVKLCLICDTIATAKALICE